MNKSPDKRYVAKYSDKEELPIPARCKTIANAVARLHSNGRRFKLKEINPCKK